MKKFSFNLKALLDLREWEEQVARNAFSQSVHEISVLEDRARLAEEEKESICQQWSESCSESFTKNDRLGLMAAIANASRASEESIRALEAAHKRRDQALAKLKYAVRSRKAVANLKQRRMEEYHAEALRQDTIEIEDIYNARIFERSGL